MRACRYLLIPVVPLVVVGLLVAEIGHEVHPALVMASVPLLATFALVAAQALSSMEGQEDDLQVGTEARTTWRLIDPELWKWGVWRAKLRPAALANGPSADLGPGEDDLRRLIGDWAHQNGWRLPRPKALQLV